MREENGIRYYAEGEKVMSTTEWRNGLTSSVDALAYRICGSAGLMSILAEAITEDDNDHLEEIANQYDKERLILIKGMYFGEGCSLVL